MKHPPVSRFYRFVTRPTKATLLTILLVVNIVVALFTVASAYGGYVDPSCFVIPALLSMMLPVFLICGLIVMVIDLVSRRRYVYIIPVSWLISLPPLLVFFPVNISSTKLLPKQESFTLLTYNAYHFMDFRGLQPQLCSNPTIDYILSTDADIVNLQEVEFLDTQKEWLITREQIDSLSNRYPYRHIDEFNQLTVLSKFPLRVGMIDMPDDMHHKMMLMQLDIHGHEVNLMNVHLESIGLSDADKELYKDLIKDPPESKNRLKQELKEVKNQLLSKLAAAFVERSEQARYVRHVIDSIGGNFIVAGDFNDIPGCYSVRTIMNGDMHDAYAENAFGPTITYHGDGFYFRIDHILYTDGLMSVDIDRGDVASSDHYPLFATFTFANPKP